MNPKPRPSILKYVAFTVLALVVLYFFNSSRRPPTSDLQVQYNQWLLSVDTMLRPGTNVLPPVAVELETVGAGLPSGKWEIRTGIASPASSSPQARDHMYRILHLIQESGVFGLPAIPDTDTATDRYKLRVDHQEIHFVISIPASYISGNIQAQNLVKLIQLYAATVPAPVAIPGQL